MTVIVIDSFLAQASGVHLIGWWMAIIMWGSFIPWAWIVSSRLDKDARYFHLNFGMWNSIHIAGGVTALIAMLFVPVPGVNVLVGLILMYTPILVYWKIRNEAVPEEHRYQLSGQSLQEKMDKRKAAKASRQAVLQFADIKGKPRDTPLRDDPLYQTHMIAEDLLGPAIEARASRLELLLGANGCTSSQLIDGVRYKREPIAPESAAGVFDYVRNLAGMDLNEKRRRQTGQFEITGPSGRVRVDLLSVASASGQVLHAEFDRENKINKPYDGLGLLNSQIEQLASLAEPHDRHGVVLIGAPRGQGLTTTAYSFLSRHDAYTANIKTLEREPLLEIDGIDHVRFDPDNPDIDYATALTSILRRDPNIVLAANVSDRETAKAAIDPGMQGPLVYIPIQQPTVVDVVRYWVKMVGDVKTAAKSLRVVTNQRLMRTLCPNCRQGYQPSPEQLKKLNLPADRAKQLYRASGKVQIKNKIENCPICSGLGYIGQTAAFEIFIVDDAARKFLAAGDLKSALQHARRNKMIYLQEAALSKVLNGETTVEEVVRATTPEAPPKRAALREVRQP